MNNNFDVIVIGSGPGGYVCAIRCAQLGLKTACIEEKKSLGGTCLNLGCIPSKSLLNASEMFHKAQKEFKNLGIETSDLRLNLSKMMANKNKTVITLTKGIEFLFKKNKIFHLKGKALISNKNTVEVASESNSKETYKTKNIIIATGSAPTSLPGIEFDEKVVVSSTGALAFDKPPKELIVIGGGYIGLELSSVWKRLGSNVTVIEYLDHIIPGMDRDISAEFLKILIKQGINFKLDSKVTGVEVTKDKGVVKFINNKTKKEEKIEGDKILIAVGRKSNIGPDIKKIGLKINKNNKIEVNEKFETSIKNIYAIGDVIDKGPMLAHKAAEEGIMAAERIFGKKSLVNYSNVPAVIYTHPEIAWVGLSEEQAKGEGFEAEVGTFSFGASGRALAANDREGLVKIISDSSSDRVLGVHILGPQASELIGQAVMAMEFGATSEDIGLTMFAHPSLSEALHEAALGIGGHAIHMANRKKKK